MCLVNYEFEASREKLTGLNVPVLSLVSFSDILEYLSNVKSEVANKLTCGIKTQWVGQIIIVRYFRSFQCPKKQNYRLKEIQYPLPVVEGSEGELGIDISKLRGQTGMVTLDNGFGNTASCSSAITFLDGEKGILRYRGYSIEELSEKATFGEVAYLLILVNYQMKY